VQRRIVVIKRKYRSPTYGGGGKNFDGSGTKSDLNQNNQRTELSAEHVKANKTVGSGLPRMSKKERINTLLKSGSGPVIEQIWLGRGTMHKKGAYCIALYQAKKKEWDGLQEVHASTKHHRAATDTMQKLSKKRANRG